MEFEGGMHYDMLKDECSYLEIMIMQACVLMRHGKSKSEALEECGITEKEFDENYSIVFPGATLDQLDEIIRICRRERGIECDSAENCDESNHL